MATQILIVLDTPPLESAEWADKVFRNANLIVANNETITTAMSKDAEAKEALLEHADDPMAAADKLAPHYKRIFEKLYGRERRVGLYGSAWMVYLNVDAVVVDWSEVEARATAEGVPPDQGEFFRKASRDFIHERANKYLQPGELFELEPPLSEAEKAEKALAFLKQKGLA